jgi:two-component system, NtrC family, sensor histidine kinase HydH
MAAAGPIGFAEIENAEVQRAFGSAFYLRVAGSPVMLGVGIAHWLASDRSVAQLALLVGLTAAIFAALVYLWRAKHTGDLRALHFKIMSVCDVVFMLAGSALSGGLDSPFIVFLPLVVAMNAVVAARRWAFTLGIASMAAAPVLVLAGGSRPLFTLGLIEFAMLLAVGAGRGMRRMYEQMLLRALEARDDVRRMHSEQLETLTTLSGEIAHELKTPLASIKGLTGLALMEIQEPTRCAERLEILGHEAVRMQKILEEFLNFSRPLSPLVFHTVDALRIGEEVVGLFEGLARERRLSIGVSGESAELRCDPRKIKQVLINLIQNSVEASPSGAEVDVVVEPRAAEAAIRVLDRGHGLPADVAQRVFQPGVTTKARGSGLGLTIARSIAEQHGGSLTLRSREGGGCVAELIIPRAQARVLAGTVAGAVAVA